MGNYITVAMIVMLLVYLICEKISIRRWEKEYRELVQQFILYKASAENRVGAGVLMQHADKLRGISNQPQQKVEEPPPTGITFKTEFRK